MNWFWLTAGLAALAASASAGTQSNAARAADKRLIVDGERAWGRAYVLGDVAAVNRLLDDRFVGVDPQGATYGKATVAREVKDGPHATSDEVGAVSVRFYGDTAIAQAHEHEVGPAPERKASEHVFTDTWRRSGGQWRIIAAEDVDVTAAASVTPGAAYAEDKAAILALRTQNNRAIASHDAEGVMALAADDYVTVGGSSDIKRGLAANLKLWADEFARPGFDRYVRTPTDLQVGERKDVLRAAESGTWEGFNHTPSGEARPFGRYFAHWTKQSGKWLVVSETYVTLGCRGPGC